MDKSFENQYALNLFGLKNGRNQVDFEINDDFIKHFPKALMSGCQVKAALTIDKYPSHLQVHFDLAGTVKVECDRCAEDMLLPIAAEHTVIYSYEKKFKNQEADEVDIVYIHENDNQLVLVQDLYDFLTISLPLRKVHEDVGETCPDYISKYLVNQTDEEEEEETEELENS